MTSPQYGLILSVHLGQLVDYAKILIKEESESNFGSHTLYDLKKHSRWSPDLDEVIYVT